MSDRKAAERAAFERVFYPDSRVLVNELGLRDAASLDAAERLFTDTRIEEGMPAAAAEPTYAGFKAIHHHLFQDLYAWAGQERTYTTGRGPTPFAPPEQIGPWMEKQFAAFRAAGELKGLGAEAFATQAAEFITEINAAHPFIEGNGRAQRVWLGGVAERAGFEFKIRPEDQAAWYEASRIGFEAANTAPMAELILARIQTLHLVESGRGPERAAQFLAMSREAALASGDGSFQAAWANLDKIAAVVGSAMAHDTDAQARLLDKARHQVAEHLRAGRAIVEVSKEQAWRNASQDQAPPCRQRPLGAAWARNPWGWRAERLPHRASEDRQGGSDLSCCRARWSCGRRLGAVFVRANFGVRGGAERRQAWSLLAAYGGRPRRVWASDLAD